VVVDAVTDPNVPPLPPHITWEQAKAMMSSLIKGDPDAADVIKQSFKGKAAEYIAT
jgi:pyruvate dehydrogenase (quinone)